MNGTTSGPLLHKLGLAKSPDSRVRLLKQLEKHFHQHAVDEFVKLLADPRFQDVEFPVVQHHVPYLKNLTVGELKAACLRNPEYKPNLQHILPYLDTSGQDLSWANVQPSETKKPPYPVFQVISDKSTAKSDGKDGEVDLKELRHFFLEVLRTVYNTQLENGGLDGRDGYVSFALIQSIDFASSDVDKGLPLDDWNATHIADNFFHRKWVTSAAKWWEKTVNKKYCCVTYSKNRVGDDRAHTLEYRKLKVKILRALSFLEAHRQARNVFTKQLSDSSGVAANENTVLEESKAESDAAQEVIDSANKDDLMIIIAHYFCAILLNKSGVYVNVLLSEGVLEPKEASVYQNEIDSLLVSVQNCSVMDSPEDVVQASKHLGATIEEAPVVGATKEPSGDEKVASTVGTGKSEGGRDVVVSGDLSKSFEA